MLNTNLNENEQKVLDALVSSSADTGHDFGWTDEIEVDGITKAQHSGYVASLSKKGWITCYLGDPEWVNGFELTAEAKTHLLGW